METPSSAAATAELARAAKQAKFALLAAVSKMSTLRPNMRTNCSSATAIAAAILKRYDLPFRVVAGYTTTTGNTEARPHVWLHTPGLPAGDGITDLTGTDDRKETPMLGQYMFNAPDSARCTYWETDRVPEGYTEPAKTMPIAVLASHCANFDMYFYRGTDALRTARDEVLTYAYATATEKMSAASSAAAAAAYAAALAGAASAAASGHP
jgi:hypothetical protein